MNSYDANALKDLLDAAQALLEARRHEMVTSAEWEALEAAVEAAEAPAPPTPASGDQRRS